LALEAAFADALKDKDSRPKKVKNYAPGASDDELNF
jgi:hypothetical protein